MTTSFDSGLPRADADAMVARRAARRGWRREEEGGAHARVRVPAWPVQQQALYSDHRQWNDGTT